MRDFALSVKVPDGFRQQFGNVRVLSLKCVPDVVDADNIALTAFEGTVDTQETNNVAVVGVEELASCRPVDANLVDLAGIVADVLDVAQYMAATVLGDKVAEVCAQAHISCRCLLRIPHTGREALEEDEALAVEQVLAQRV